jgi:glycolate oxidase iron-sulfur subunit
MQTQLHPSFRNRVDGPEAEAILRSCVHCGFCNATCPTYRLLGDERDGPRGRIYLMKSLLETGDATARTRTHLDRCLTCRACETTCPSGVRYGRLADFARGVLEERVPRPITDRLQRWAVRSIFSRRRLFAPVWFLARWLRPVLPKSLRAKIVRTGEAGVWPLPRHRRGMLVLEGCVQPVLAPAIDAATARVFDRIGISLFRVPGGGCCGALSYHLGAREEGLACMRRNIDAWYPWIERGAEAVIVTASGCGLMVREYGQALRHDPRYAARAAAIAERVRDPGEILADEDLSMLSIDSRGPVAFHAPCTLQHGVNLHGVVEDVLRRVGVELVPVADAQQCCGSAGSYSLLQPELAGRLRTLKLAALQRDRPGAIVTANIGCLMHLAAGAKVPVRHWIELLDGRAASSN